jgi:hypothetical protein
MELGLSYEELQILPELATLEVLDSILQTTIRALHAVQPELIDNEENPSLPKPLTASACAADVIVQLSRTLLDAIDRYQRINYHRLQNGSNHICVSDPF